MSFRVSVAGRFALDALASGTGEVKAVFQRSFYVEAGGRYACIGDAALGRGPLNALVEGFFLPALNETVAFSTNTASPWTPPAFRAFDAEILAKAHPPAEGLGGLAIGQHNALSGHAWPALDALERFLVGNALDDDAAQLIGLGPGLTPSGDDYLGGMMVALRLSGRRMQADGLWRWLQPRLGRTSAISAAHLAAAAAGEAHEVLHQVLNGDADPSKLDTVGHCSGWDAFAGAVAVLKT